jgi:hypothetical protein
VGWDGRRVPNEVSIKYLLKKSKNYRDIIQVKSVYEEEEGGDDPSQRCIS